MTPAEEIRSAAAKVREAAAELLPVSTWWSTSPWASLMHPGLADPLASWLEACARNADHMTHDTDWGICDEPASVQAALAVARAINGEA